MRMRNLLKDTMLFIKPAGMGVRRRLYSVSRNKKFFREGVSAPHLTVKNLPIEVFIEVTNFCNLSCSMCREHNSLYGKADFLRLGTVKDRLRTVSKAAYRINLNGWGEPLRHPDFGEFIAGLRRHNRSSELVFTTNGQLFDPKIIGQIIDADVASLVISIDSVDREIYESIRRGGSFERLDRNIKLFNEIKSSRRSVLPFLCMEIVLMRNNISRIMDNLEYAARNGFRTIILERVRGYPDLEVRDYSPYKDLINDFFTRAGELGIELGGPFVSHRPDLRPPGDTIEKKPGQNSLEEADPRQIPPMKCLQPWHTAFITCRADIRPCCIAGDALNCGNLNEQSFDDIWNGRTFRELRQSIVKGEYNSDCRACILGQRTPGVLF